MNSVSCYVSSSIGKKQLMAITGLAWCGFVLSHMLGNLLYLIGPEAYNAYGHAITGNKPVYYAIETVLALTLLGHMLFAALVVIENKKARPVGYAVNPGMGTKGGASLASKTMQYSGAVMLFFIISHLLKFRFGEYYPFTIKGEEVRDLHKLMTEVFQSAGFVAWYVVSLTVLGLHLSHALWSSLQTLGLVPGGKETKIRCLSLAFGWSVAIGFVINPILIFLRG